MIKIRRHTFETNSSSMHSLVVMKTGEHVSKEKAREDIYIREGTNKYRIWNDEDVYFERYPFGILSTVADKFRYLVALYSYDEEKRNQIIEDFKSITGLDEIEFPDIDDEPFYGSVDHQSCCLVPSFLDKNKISFKEFMENDKYKVIIDGDEYCNWEKAKKSGLIATDEIELDIDIYSKDRENEDLDEER